MADMGADHMPITDFMVGQLNLQGHAHRIFKAGGGREQSVMRTTRFVSFGKQ